MVNGRSQMDSKGGFLDFYEYLFEVQSKLGVRLDEILEGPEENNGENLLMWKYFKIDQILCVDLDQYRWRDKKTVTNNTVNHRYTTQKHLDFYHVDTLMPLRLTLNNNLNEVTISFLTGPQEQSIVYVYLLQDGCWKMTWSNVPIPEK